MKKFLTAFLVLTACLCAAFAIGCGSGCKKDKELTFTVEFVATEGVTYTGKSFKDGAAASGKVTVKANSEVTFGVDCADSQDVIVKADDSIITPVNGEYKYVVTADAKITTELYDHVMQGNGTYTNPFKITRGYDLIHIAEQVNGGYAAYVNGYYSLENDIDMKGGALNTIGDGSPVGSDKIPAYFAGFFEGNGHTVSNFTITSANKNYAGFFGAVLVGNAGDSGIIQNLKLDNFTVRVNSSDFDGSVYAGSLIGRGIGSMLLACSATNGKIEIATPSIYFSYAGGAIGQQVSNYSVSGGYANYDYATTDYVYTDVDIQVNGGTVVAGGIAGSLNSVDMPDAAASVVNCYSYGDVTNARLAGGIVGRLDAYSSVANCYSTGAVTAQYNAALDINAYAGGIAGFCNIGSVISDSFTKSTVTATATGNHGIKGDIVGGSEEEQLTIPAVTVINCYHGSEADNSAAFFEKLGWQSCDWVLTAGSLPTINYDTVETNAFTIKYVFVDNRVNKESYINYNFEINNYYLPFNSYYYAEPYLGYSFVSDTAGYASYGVFFDEQCTCRVPESYVPTKSVNLYVGFANYGEVAGDYYVEHNGRTVKIQLDARGNYTYNDGISYSSTYTYDGTRLVLANGLFARLADYTYVIGDEEHPEYNYDMYPFVGEKDGENLKIYTSLNFFTEATPLILTKGESVKETDGFLGVWELSATIGKKYSFDGNGGWSYSYKGVTKSGSYTVESGVAQLKLSDGTAYGTASLSDTLLSVTVGGNKELYSAEGSLSGVWYDFENEYTLRLDGFGNGKFGSGLITGYGVRYDLVYVADEGFGADRLTLLSDVYLFGYVYQDGNKLQCVVFDGSAEGGKLTLTFYLLDDLMGEWISENNGNLLTVDFNGNGLYDAEADGVSGLVIVGGQEVAYAALDGENGISATFTVDGVTYTAVYDEIAKKLVVTSDGAGNEYTRKDNWSNFVLTNGNGLGSSYYDLSFNGAGKLAMGGVITVTDASGEKVTEVGYRTANDGITELDSTGKSDAGVTLFDLETKAEVGSITIEEYKFFLLYNGSDSTLRKLNGKSLCLQNDFSGQWACYDGENFTVGTFDLSFKATGKFRDMTSTTYVLDVASDTVSLAYMSNNSEMTQAVTLYLLPDNGDLFISGYTYVVAGDAIPCSRPDALFGEWNSTVDNGVLKFNGLANNRSTVAMLQYSVNGEQYPYTARFGKYYMWTDDEATTGYIMNISASTGKKGENIFERGGLCLEFVEVNFEEPVLTVTDDNGVEYTLYFNGEIRIGEILADYAIDTVSNGITVIEVDYGGGDKEKLEIDHTDRNNPTIKLLED